MGLLLRRCRGQGPHLTMTREQRGFSRVAAGFSSYDGEFRLHLVLAQGSPIFHSSCEGKLVVAVESLSGLKGVKPPLQFGESTRDCSPCLAGKEGPHLAMTGASHGFP